MEVSWMLQRLPGATARSRTASVLGSGDRGKTRCQTGVGREHRGPWGSTTGTDSPQGAKRMSWAMAVARGTWRAGQGQGGSSDPSALTVFSRGKHWYQHCHGCKSENCVSGMQLQQNPQGKCPKEAELHLIPQAGCCTSPQRLFLGWSQCAEMAP